MKTPPSGGNAIKKPSPKQKKAAPKAPAGKAKGGGKDMVVFGLNVSALIAKLKSKKRPGKPEPVEEDPDEPVEVFVEVMESDEPPPPTGPKSRVRYDDDEDAPPFRAGRRSRPAARDAFPEDDGDFDGEDEEEEAPKKRGLFGLFGGKKKAKPSKSAKQAKEEKSAKKKKPAPPPEDDGEEYEDPDEPDDFDEEMDEEEEEDVSPRSRKGKKDKPGKKSGKSARGGRKKKKGASPAVMVLLVLVLLAALAYVANMYGLIDLNIYINNITDSLSMLLTMVGL